MCHGPVHPRALCPLQDFTKLSESTTPLPLLRNTAGIQQTRGINCKDLFALPPTATHNVLSRISTRSHPEQLSAAALCPQGIKTPNHHSPRVLLTALRCSSGPFAPLLRTEFRNPPQAPCPHCSHHAAPSPAFPERIPTSSRYSHAISPALLRDSLGPPPTSSPNRSRTSECGRPVRPSIRPSHRIPSRPVPPGGTLRPHSPAKPRSASSPPGLSDVRPQRVLCALTAVIGVREEECEPAGKATEKAQRPPTAPTAKKELPKVPWPQPQPFPARTRAPKHKL